MKKRQALGAVSAEERRFRTTTAFMNYQTVRAGSHKRAEPTSDFCGWAWQILREADETLRNVPDVSPAMKAARRQALAIFRRRCT